MDVGPELTCRPVQVNPQIIGNPSARSAVLRRRRHLRRGQHLPRHQLHGLLCRYLPAPMLHGYL